MHPSRNAEFLRINAVRPEPLWAVSTGWDTTYTGMTVAYEAGARAQAGVYGETVARHPI
jgi:hypothetical protein